MIRLSLPLSQFFNVFRLEEPRVPQALDDRIYITHDDALDRELAVQDESLNGLVIGAANTEGTLAFSFANDHYIQAIHFGLRTNPANLEYVYLVSQAFGQVEQCPLFFGVQTDVVTHTTRNISGFAVLATIGNQVQVGLPMFGRRETDYTVLARSNAGGGCTLDVRIRRTEATEGVKIVR